MKPNAYVVGFNFNQACTKVALIRKSKPEWQKGLLNGIGGKIENGETPLEAMAREFREEAGPYMTFWKHFALLTGPDFSVDFFAIIGELQFLESQEEEKIEIVDLSDMYHLQSGMIENLPWLISLALDHLKDGRPSFVTAEYP